MTNREIYFGREKMISGILHSYSAFDKHIIDRFVLNSAAVRLIESSMFTKKSFWLFCKQCLQITE